MSLKGKTAFITGGSRGIGKAIALRLAQEGANVVIAAKTATPHPKLPGTIYTTAEEIEAAGGQALPLVVDIRSEELVEDAVAQTVAKFGGIDFCINNASAINLSGTLALSMKRFDLMQQVNVRGTFLTSQKCLPHLLKSDNPHILNLAPPLTFEEKWFKNHVAYSIAKYGMSLCVLGMAGEFRGQVGINALWPKTTIATAAVSSMPGGEHLVERSRKASIMGEAAFHILNKDGKRCTGNYFIDEEVLLEEGMTDLSQYAENPKFKDELMPDLFV